MKNKYTFWLILLAVFSSNFAFSQTNPTNMVGAWQQKDTVGGKVVQFRNSSTSLGVTKVVTPATLRDSLKNYAQIQDGLISGGEATLGVGSVTIDTAVYRINKVQYTSFNTVFSGIANSPSGTQYYLVVYGEIGGTLDTISGARDTIAVLPTIPANTVKINTILVGDGGVESATPDLSGFWKLVGDNNAIGNQNIIGNIQVSDFIKLTSFSGEKRILLGNQDSGGVNYPSIIQAENGNIRFGTGNSWSGNGGTFTGNVLINNTGDVTANSFKTPTGTSSQFLKANGTLDNSSYALNSSLASYVTLSTNQSILGLKTFTNDALFGSSNLFRILSNGQVVDFSNAAQNAYVAGRINGLNLKLYTNSGTGIDVDNTGNVGIGITSPTSLLHVNGLARATGFGAGIAPSANHYLTTAANTSTIGSWLWTPSSTDYTGTVSGTFYNNANELKFYDGTISGTNRLVKLRNNQSLAGSGTVGVISNNSGDISTVPIADRLIAGEVQTSANRTLTLTDFGTNGTLTVYCTTSGGDVTITLPSPTDMRYLEVTIIKVTTNNNVIISGSANINGSASISESAQYKSYTLVSNGTQYYIKGERP